MSHAVALVCSDEAEHRRRVESRSAGNRTLTWQEVVGRKFDPLDPAVGVIDTSRQSIEQASPPCKRYCRIAADRQGVSDQRIVAPIARPTIASYGDARLIGKAIAPVLLRRILPHIIAFPLAPPPEGAYFFCIRSFRLEALTDEEFAALQEVGKGLTQRIIPTEQRDVLIALRYIKRRVLVVSR